MNIHATDIARTFGRQTRAYAEYRIFASLARFSDVVREATVSLTPTSTDHTVVCVVVLDVRTGEPVRTQRADVTPTMPSTAPHIGSDRRCADAYLWRREPDKEQGLSMTRVVFRRIVCAVDLSDQAAPSLERALQLAQLHGGELLVVHVTNGRLATESDRRTVTDAFSQLQRLTKIASKDRVSVRWIMASGNPAMEIARFVRSTDSDLAIVGRALPRYSCHTHPLSLLAPATR